MKSIFVLFVFAVSFCCGAFSQDTSDTLSSGSMDTNVVPQADIPESGEPADTKGLVTDDGVTPAGDYGKVPKSISDSGADLGLRKGPPKQPTASANAPDSDTDLDIGATGSGEDTTAPAKSEPSDTYGE